MILEKVDPRSIEAAFGIAMTDREVSVVEPCASIEDRMMRNHYIAKDRAFCAMAGADTPPIWMCRDFRWGPHSWPVRWREIPKMAYQDCGLMAALSTEIYRARGLCAVSVQMILAFNKVSTRGWQGLWRGEKLAAPWSSDRYAYHEGTALVGSRGNVNIWDPLGRFWLKLHDNENYEAIVAFKLCAPDAIAPLMQHQNCRIPLNVWLQRQQAQPSKKRIFFLGINPKAATSAVAQDLPDPGLTPRGRRKSS